MLLEHEGVYRLLGATRDDAAGEAFDKVARMLDLPYPGGPEISKLAREAREKNVPPLPDFRAPRPMVDSADCDFSFSGLKTGVRYFLDAHGVSVPCVRGTPSRVGGQVPVLDYGGTSTVGPYTCTSATNGVTCTTAQGVGFRLARQELVTLP